MTRAAHVLTLLAVIAVPLVGWFTQDWSGATTLAVYWFETLAACVFISARVAFHQRWTPRRGHFRYQGPTGDRRGAQSSTFLSGFALITFAFSAAHGLFLAVILFLLHHNGQSQLALIDWHSVGFGCLTVFGLLTFDFVIDLLTLRGWTFRQLEQTADRGLSRIIVVHLTLTVGFIGVALTDAPDAFFGVFVVLKSLAALSGVVPQWEPAVAPKWLSDMMNRVPSVHRGKRFEEFWAQDRADEEKRRARNEESWAAGR
ncbi:MAG: hypothetical protein K0R68_2999 [Mycobacterium sp.]|nr:hypothetical protein [Mycobacterium sp.]